MKYLTFSLLCFVMTPLSTVVQTRGIVLIDGEAWVVDMSDRGAILARFKRIDDYFTGNRSDEEIIASINPDQVFDDFTLDFFLNEAEGDTIDNQPYIPDLVVTKERINGNESPPSADLGENTQSQYVSFSLNRAVLNRDAVGQIRKISRAYLRYEFSNLEILSFHKGDKETKRLADNRARAINDLLLTFGVPNEVIKMTIGGAPANANLSFVSIALK